MHRFKYMDRVVVVSDGFYQGTVGACIGINEPYKGENVYIIRLDGDEGRRTIECTESELELVGSAIKNG